MLPGSAPVGADWLCHFPLGHMIKNNHLRWVAVVGVALYIVLQKNREGEKQTRRAAGGPR